MKTLIIIPAHNEEKRIGETLEDYGSFFRSKDFKILVVINNTKDKTEEIVKSYCKKYKNITYLNFKEGGKGFAIQEGFKYGLKNDYDYIGFTDADNSTNPQEFYFLLKNLSRGNHGFIGSRYLPDSIIYPKQPFIRILMSRVFNFVVRSLFLFKFRDTQNGAKVFKKEAIKQIINKLSITQWAFDIDLLYQLNKQGFKIIEFPILWRNKEGSKINVIRSSLQMFFAVLQLRLLNSPFKRLYLLIKPLARIFYNFIR